MAIIVKKIRDREYAYRVIREGKRVVHKYIGPAGSPKAMKGLQEESETTAVPSRFRPLFWDTSIEKIHIRRNAGYIIERILELGDLNEVQWLQKVYPGRHIIEVLRLSRQLTERSRNFWMLWFGVESA